MTTKTPPPAPPADPHAETVAALEAAVVALNRQWAKYRAFQPLSASTLGPAAIDPTMLVRKYELGVEIDRLNVDLETARAEQARAALAALLDPATDARLTAEKDAAYG